MAHAGIPGAGARKRHERHFVGTCTEHSARSSPHEPIGPHPALLTEQDPRLDRHPVHRQQPMIIRVQSDPDLHLAFRQSPDVHP